MKGKLLLASTLCALVASSAALCTACKGAGEELSVYCPDGAPALALTKAISENEAREEELFDFDIVDANQINAYVTGADPRADVCILPVNAAAKALGSGDTYSLVGTVTNGNLYFLTTGDNPTLSKENLKETLAGKKVGVVQLNNVPGLTLQVVLKDLGIDYAIVQSASEDAKEDKVSLIPFQPTDVTPASGCDYYLVPEPAMSTKIKGTAEGKIPFKQAGNLQALYGEGDGYPQAVLVAKKSVLNRRRKDIDLLVSEIEGAMEFMENAEIARILSLLDTEREDGVAPSFNANNLTFEVISRCSINYVPAKEEKERIDTFLEKLIEVNADSAAIPADGFYDMG